VSTIGLGGNTFGMACDKAATADVLHAARDAGINCVDTSDVYGGGGVSEEYIGAAIQGERDRWVVMTKFAIPMGKGPNTGGASRGYARKAVEASLRRLGTDYIDVYQVHRPDPNTPMEETMAALHELVLEGKVRYLGCSNYAAWQIAESNWIAKHHGWTPFISSQPSYNMINRTVEREHIPACAHYGLGVLPWGPLAGGFLTGKYRRGEAFPEGTRMASSEWARAVLTDRNWDRLDKLQALAQSRGLTMTQLAFGWLLAQPAVSSVIAGATSPAQVQQNAACHEVRLTAEDLAAVPD
jgi:aryl-alcohol dehydrogenase-like predicted oxidoreductase